MIAIDTETELIGPDNPLENVQIPRLVCVSFARENGQSNVVPWNLRSLEMSISDLLMFPIVGHNIAYDALVLARQFPALLPLIFRAYDEDRVTDTGLRAKLLDIADGRRTWVEDDGAPKGIRRAAYGLADLSQRYLARRLSKDGIRLEYAQLRDVPFDRWPAAAVEYSRDDAVATWDIWQAQEARAGELQDQHRQARAELALKLASAWGLVSDPSAVAALAARVDRELDEHGTILRANGLLRADGTRAMDTVKARVAAAYDGDPPRTDKGGVKTDRETCERTADPVLATFATYAKLLAVRRKDVPMLTASPSIHTRFETLVETGRTASREPNVQNLSRHGGVRECFSAREGCAYVVADYAGMELATLAQVCLVLVGRSELAHVLRAGEDPHLRVASLILGREYEDVRAVYKAHGPGYDDVYNARQTGKVANFGFPGGLGATRLVHFARQAYQVTMTENEARRLKDVWLHAFP
jgi:DNA polymerase-1